MRRTVCIFLLCGLWAGLPACRQKPEKNQVEIDQIEADRSNNYRYIFRDRIEKEKAEERRDRRRNDPFKQ